MDKLNIALLQLAPTNSIDENLKKGLEACRKAKGMGADLVLFPEIWQIGYESKLMIPNNAITHQSDFIKQHQELAKELELCIAITYLGKGKDKPTNNTAIIDNNGDIILDYAKVHICGFKGGEEVTLEPGNEFKVAELHYNGGCIKIGVMTCFDREFPESARTLMLKGAEIVVTPNACSLHNSKTLRDVKLVAFRTRAFENMMGAAMTNYPEPKHDGHSCAFDAKGFEIAMADQKESIVLAKFDIEAIREWRKKEEGIRDAKARMPYAYE